MEGQGLRRIFLREGRISSNDGWPLLYIPRIAIETLGLRKGAKVRLYIDVQDGALVVKPVHGSKVLPGVFLNE